MENEELFAGEPAVDIQQQNAADSRRAAAALKDAPLQIHTEPLLAGDDSDNESPQYEHPPVIDTRPRWRRPHVSDPDSGARRQHPDARRW